jgi:hypothetical protein
MVNVQFWRNVSWFAFLRRSPGPQLTGPPDSGSFLDPILRSRRPNPVMGPSSVGSSENSGPDASGQLNIHIAIISPPQRNPVDNALTQAVANLQSQSASLARQQQRLEALRTQQLELQRERLQFQRSQDLRQAISLMDELTDTLNSEIELESLGRRNESSSALADGGSLTDIDVLIPSDSNGQSARSRGNFGMDAMFNDISAMLSELGIAPNDIGGETLMPSSSSAAVSPGGGSGRHARIDGGNFANHARQVECADVATSSAVSSSSSANSPNRSHEGRSAAGVVPSTQPRRRSLFQRLQS